MTRSAFDEILADEYSVAEEASRIGSTVIAEFPDVHGHLEAATIGYLFRDDEVRDKETKVVNASAHLVSQLISGAGAKYFNRYLKWALQQQLGFLPTFLILIDRNGWKGGDFRWKKFLVDHELEHCIQKVNDDGFPRVNQVTGEPVWGIKPHDLEEFEGAIQRNGLVTEEHRSMAAVMVDAAIRDANDAKLTAA